MVGDQQFVFEIFRIERCGGAFASKVAEAQICILAPLCRIRIFFFSWDDLDYSSL